VARRVLWPECEAPKHTAVTFTPTIGLRGILGRSPNIWPPVRAIWVELSLQKLFFPDRGFLNIEN
jgi:hypothetical protein